MQNFRQTEKAGKRKDYFIDVMGITDLDDVLQIERSTFPCPWTKANFLFEIEQNKCAHNFVVRCRDEAGLLGFSSVWILFDELKINNIAIAKEHRGKGLGTYLMEHIIEYGFRRGCDNATLEVRPSNRVAISMYRKFGFQIRGLRKNYYSDNGEDAFFMFLDINEWMKRTDIA